MCDFIIKIIIKRKIERKERMPPVLLNNGLLSALRGEQSDSFVFAGNELPCAQMSDSSGKILSLGPCHA